MSTKLAKRPPVIHRRSGPSAKALSRIAASKASATARKSAHRVMRNGTIIGAVSAGALGYAERSGMALPTFGGIDPSLLYGGVLGVVLPMFVKGKLGTMSEQVGSGMLDVAAYKFGAGMPVLRGEYDNVAGDEAAW